jgi:alpha-tubulin suppressor-like RCC1 family protein
MNKVVVVCFIVFFICELNAQLTSKLVSFGKNNHGQSGTNTISNIQIPTLTQDIGDVKFEKKNSKKNRDFAVGSSSVVAISFQNGVTSLWTWGSNSAGQLGVGSSINSSLVPIKMDLSATSLAGRIPSEVSIGASFVLVKATDNTLHAFGDNTYGQLGIGNTDGQVTLNSFKNLSTVHSKTR